MLSAFDFLLAGFTITIMSMGFSRRLSAWKIGQAENRVGDLRGVISYLLGHKRILKKRWIGFFHLFLFWGIIFHLLLVVLSQFGLVVPGPAARMLSFVTDVLGCVMLLGVTFFLIRKLCKLAEPQMKAGILPLLVFLLIVISGFFTEGVRLSIVQPDFSWVSPAGWVFSTFLPASPYSMQIMMRLHFYSVLFFITILPFTFMRHVVADVLNVYYRYKDAHEAFRPVSLSDGSVGARTIKDFSWKQLLDSDACVSCGRCSENCPATLSGKELSPKNVIRNIFQQMEKTNTRGSTSENDISPLLEDVISNDEVWECTLCLSCFENCPVYVPTFDKLLDMRRNQVMMESNFYPEIGNLFRSVETFGDTFGKGKAYREDWATGLNIKTISECEQVDVLFWVGCQATFHERGRLITTSLAHLFKEAGVDFAILGKNELCCGEQIRKMGNEYLFQQLAEKNIETLQGMNFKRIVTYCPHCLNTLKNEYPEFNGNFEVIHYTDLLRDLIKNGDLKIKKESNKKIVYHDPCYLARANDIHEKPREILQSIPGMKLSEPQHCKRDTGCCGAGGGHMWMRETAGQKLNDVRVKELLETKPEMIVTSCPYCLVMFDDALRNLGSEDVKCLDIVEIIRESV